MMPHSFRSIPVVHYERKKVVKKWATFREDKTGHSRPAG